MACHSQFVHSQYYFASERFNLESVYLRVKNMFLFQQSFIIQSFIIQSFIIHTLTGLFVSHFVERFMKCLRQHKFTGSFMKHLNSMLIIFP